MQKKIKFKKFIIWILALFISIFLITILLGRNETVGVWIVTKDGIDTNKTIGEQKKNFFTEIKISKEDLDKFGTSIITDSEMDKYLNKKLNVALEKGSPIPKSAISDAGSGGTFASSMAKYHTIYQLSSSNTLPPGTVPGDKIDILVNVNRNDTETSGILYRDIPIYSIDQSGVYIEVTQKQYQQLELAKKLGDFMLQLPGRKEVDECSQEQLKNRNKDNIDCYVSDDNAGTVTSDDVLQMILNNQVSSNENNIDLGNNQNSDSTESNQKNN
jgi:hypothetical protein